MSGVTDAVFRRLAESLGASYTVTEMVAAEGFSAGAEEARLRAERSGAARHIVQLAGRQPDWIAEAARVAAASGATEIDLNMGCPAKKVVGGHGGSALLRDLDLAERIVAAAAAAVPVPVTVKMRLGWDETCIVAPDLARRAERSGARRITVHGRTRAQFYTGRADWRAIRAVVDATCLPVVANGDIAGLADAQEALLRSGASGLMVGRAAQGRPWLPGHLAKAMRDGLMPPAPTLDEQAAVAIAHYDGLLTLLGRDVGLRHARKHLAAYVAAAEDTAGRRVPPEERTALLASTDPARVVRMLREAYDGLAWRKAA